jgi:hypothetical protein
MDFVNYAQLIGFIITLIIAIWNVRNNRLRTSSQNLLEGGQYLETVNKSIELANKRALDAELRANEADARLEQVIKESEAREAVLEARLTTLEKSLSYRLVFDVMLGQNPSVEKVEIKHFPERRADSPYKGKERRFDE